MGEHDDPGEFAPPIDQPQQDAAAAELRYQQSNQQAENVAKDGDEAEAADPVVLEDLAIEGPEVEAPSDDE